jgi:tRNA U34 5-carboxymethylaminomethyl modifying enzyme MnmG/GidA
VKRADKLEKASSLLNLESEMISAVASFEKSETHSMKVALLAVIFLRAMVWMALVTYEAGSHVMTSKVMKWRRLLRQETKVKRGKCGDDHLISWI